MDDAAEWTLDELVRRAGLSLTDGALVGTYAGAPNGRVRELPDQRMIRWYTSIGLVDRPIGGRGRGARYGPRHLRQLVAVKQLQAQGLPLAEIQGRLAGISDADLARLAAVPAEALGPAPPTAPAPPPAPEPRVDGEYPTAQRFWSVAPARHAAPASPVVRPLTGLELAPGVLLVLPVTPRPDDLAALGEAARPLLAALTHRGLIPTSTPLADPTEGAPR